MLLLLKNIFIVWYYTVCAPCGQWCSGLGEHDTWWHCHTLLDSLGSRSDNFVAAYKRRCQHSALAQEKPNAKVGECVVACAKMLVVGAVRSPYRDCV